MRTTTEAGRVGFGRRLVTLSLTAALVVPNVACASGGPLQVKLGPDASAKLADWSRVQRLVTPTEIVLTTDEGTSVRRLLGADAAGIALLEADPTVPDRVSDFLRDMARAKPERVAGVTDRVTLTGGNIEVGPSGIFVKGQRVADTAAVVTRMDRERIRSIRGSVNARGNAGAALAGALVGGGLAGPLIISTGMTGGLGLVLVLGMTAASAALASLAGTHKTEGLVYQRASDGA